MLTGFSGLPGHWIVQLCSITWGDGMLGAMGVDCSSKSNILRDILASLAVLRAVFSIFTCCSVNLLDQWKCRNEVMWSMHCLCRNGSNSLAVKGGQVSEYRMLGGP